MQLPGLAAEKALAEIVGIPQVEVTHLGALDTGDTKKMPGRDVEGPAVTRRHEQLIHPLGALPGAFIKSGIERGQLAHLIADQRAGIAAGVGVFGCGDGSGHGGGRRGVGRIAGIWFTIPVFRIRAQ